MNQTQERKAELHEEVKSSLEKLPAIKHSFESSTIELMDFGILKLKGQLARTKTIALHDYWLPKAIFSEGPVRLTSRPDVLTLLLTCLDAYAQSCSLSKSLPLALVTRFCLLLKVVEYGWLNQCYRMSDWTPSLFDSLASDVGLRGWVSALQIQSRLLKLEALENCSYQTPTALMAAIGSSVQKRDFSGWLYAKQGCVRKIEPASFRPMLFTSLSPVLEGANQLCEASGVRRPFERPNRYAEALLGNARKSAASMSPDSLAQLMVNTVQYALRVASPLTAVFEGLFAWRKGRPAGDSVTQSDWAEAFQSLSARCDLEVAVQASVCLGAPTVEGEISLYGIVTAFHASSFLPLAFMNARRKDEIIDPEIGLQKDCLKLAHAGLDIYTADFYIEKSIKHRISMYVNPLSKELIENLDAFARGAVKFEEVHRFDKELASHVKGSIFIVPDFRSQHSSGNRIRSFMWHKAAATGVWAYVRSVIGHIYEELSTNQMRRAYALFHHYRYENSSLSALRQKLGHRSLGEVRSYVLDRGHTDALGQALYGPLTVSQKAALSKEGRELAEAMDKVGGEKFLALIAKVMQDDEYLVGGFPKLIRRYIKVVRSDVSYQEMDDERVAKAVAQRLRGKGHAPHPKLDGNCWRGNSSSRHQAACQDRGDRTPNLERASPEICNDCYYNEARRQHTENLRNEVKLEEAQLVAMPLGTLDRAKSEAVVRSLRRVIQIREARDARFEAGDPR